MKKSDNNQLSNERRKRFLENLIKEAIINVLAEQAEVPPASPAPPAPQPMGAGTTPPPPLEAPAEPEEEEFTVDSMIERLNVIRGGKSFTDPIIYGQMVSYFKSLTEEQKVSLRDFLVSLSKIVISVKEDEEGTKPATPVPAQPPPSVPSAPPPAPGPEAAPIAENRKVQAPIKPKSSAVNNNKNKS